jgi:HAD superfamily phosphoserine phosphatase-like hydrolase
MTLHPPPGSLRHPGWNASVRAGLEQLLAGPPGVALFDCDETLLCGDISETTLADLAADSEEPLVERYEEHVRRDTLGAYVALVHTLVAGRTEPEVRRLAQRTLQRHPELRLRGALRELVASLQAAGWDVWVITASPETLVEVVVEPLHLAPHRVIGMRSARDADGRFVARLTEPPTWREGKVAAWERTSGLRPRLAVGDSAGDLPMMRLAEHAVLVDRGQSEVRRAAEECGAWIQPAATLTEAP